MSSLKDYLALKELTWIARLYPGESDPYHAAMQELKGKLSHEDVEAIQKKSMIHLLLTVEWAREKGNRPSMDNIPFEAKRPEEIRNFFSSTVAALSLMKLQLKHKSETKKEPNVDLVDARYVLCEDGFTHWEILLRGERSEELADQLTQEQSKIFGKDVVVLWLQ